MKFFHLADLHIGKQVNGFSMLEDQRYIFNQILEYADTEQPQAVVIAGDLYDKPVPGTEAVQLFDWFLTELAGRKISVIAVSGNHDSPERVSFADQIMKQQGVYLYGTFDGHCRKVVLEDSHGPVNFYLLPFLKPSFVKRYYPDQGVDSYHDAVKTVLQEEELDKQVRSVLVAHQFMVAAGEDPERSESEVGPVGGIDSVDISAVAGFDYVALGHLHKAQRLGKEEIRYAGSPLKYSASEHLHKKSMPVITMKEKGEVELQKLPLIPLRDMRVIRGPLDEITRQDIVKESNWEDYLHITLTDDEEILDVIGKIRSVYPNVMTLSFDNRRMQAELNPEASAEAAQKTPRELFDIFYEEQNGSGLQEDEAMVMNKLFEEAGDSI